MSQKRPRVLVLDGMWNKSLAAVRSLGERGFDVTAAEKTRFATALFSRYATKKLVYPSPTASPDGFMQWLLTELKKSGGYDLVLPTELSTQLLLAKNQDKLKPFVGFPFPGVALTENVHDKGWLMRFAQERGYPTPETIYTDESSDIGELIKKISCPLVIKPRESSGSRGIEYVNKREDFEESFARVHKSYPYPIIQEYIPPATDGSGGFGVGALFNYDHEPRASFVYKRLREYPVSGGPSTLRESVRYDELREIAIGILKELKWVGPAMVEFKIDPRDGSPKLLEINPRLWGSLKLAILSGVDFPYLLYKLAADGDVKAVTDYRVGVRCRWLIPGDLMHLLSAKKNMKNLLDFLRPSDGDDILSLKDPMPILGRFSSLFPFLLDKEMRRLLFR
ncbi:ATP-grasp enzyme-like protein [hydrothermal vent metagenome]|uniref:ATP-grasp enzyme-like protein n=1 Tax=hydrothermal vent metagenome TaxID=652676 RepID=A0A3B0RFU6_9ZZZZ